MERKARKGCNDTKTQGYKGVMREGSHRVRQTNEREN